jgi:hypothetical protein
VGGAQPTETFAREKFLKNVEPAPPPTKKPPGAAVSQKHVSYQIAIIQVKFNGTW